MITDDASTLLCCAFRHAVEGKSTDEERRVLARQIRQYVHEVKSKCLEYMAFRLLAKLDEEKRNGTRLFGDDWSELCDEMFAEYNRRLEKDEHGDKEDQ